MSLRGVALDDRYRLDDQPILLNGTQALVRLTMLELRRRRTGDRRAGVYVTGYRGSPLGGFDAAMMQAKPHLGPDILLRPAVNEDLAATAVWGTQQLGVFGEPAYDGVSALWYGKGPGVDRTGDVFKHANLAGVSAAGGVLVVAGDDHTCKSSTTAHQSEFGLIDAWIPVLAPASVAEIMEYGLIAWDMSRYAGLWCATKVVTEIMDTTQTVLADPQVSPRLPGDFALPPHGLGLRWPDAPLAQEERLHQLKLPAALAYGRANGVDRLVIDAPDAWLGIVTVGKSHGDTLQALRELGLDEAAAASLGLRLLKIGMPWPLEPQAVRAFASGLREIVVIEEKRGLVEGQLRQHLYGLTRQPDIVGKQDTAGAPLLPSYGDLDATKIALVLGDMILRRLRPDGLEVRLKALRAAAQGLAASDQIAVRPPHFCPGCPHNTSTQVPEGATAFAGIGCHYLALPMERRTEGFTHMGGEGANWIGLSAFSKTKHVFQNLGDGTYFHSGSLAVRAAVAAKVNITYKILFNGAVAMTGGQPIDGELSPARIAEQMLAEGVARVVVVSDDPARTAAERFDPAVQVRPRSELENVQRELGEIAGVSVLIYDQECATELRRKRKRGQALDPGKTVVINDLVCEGCGDCSVQSNCLAVAPLETEFGRKRQIDPSACNKDLSCTEGFCPSFVTVRGTARRPTGLEAPTVDLPALQRAVRGPVNSILVAGIGGTGVVTVGAILGMAAHLEGKAARVMDMTGLAQKGGAVVSHIQIAAPEESIVSSRIGAASADVLVACDLVVAAAPEICGRLSAGGRIVASEHEAITSQFTRERDFAVPVARLKRRLERSVGNGMAVFLDAHRLALALVGDAVGANLMLVGCAWQQGLIDLSLEALERAIALNGAAVEVNLRAFAWGRLAALDPARVQDAAATKRGGPQHHRLSASLDEVIARRAAFLTDYQDAGYARRFLEAIECVQAAEQRLAGGTERLTRAAAESLFRLMAYKDEYEVGRLYAQTGFLDQLKRDFEGRVDVTFHLAPPALGTAGGGRTRPRKRAFGPWAIWIFRLLARLRRLRGTPFDPFGLTAERRTERADREAFLRLLAELADRLTLENFEAALALAALPQEVRGYGPIKAEARRRAKARQQALWDVWQAAVESPITTSG